MCRYLKLWPTLISLINDCFSKYLKVKKFQNSGGAQQKDLLFRSLINSAVQTIIKVTVGVWGGIFFPSGIAQ